MTRCNQHDGEWELLLLGTLDPAASKAMRAHVASGCSHCLERWAEAVRLTSALGAALQPVEPPPQAEQRLLQRLLEVSADTARTPAVRVDRTAWAWRTTGVAAALLLLAGGSWLGWQNADLRRRLALSERQGRSVPAAPPAAASPAPLVPPSSAPAAPAPERARWERERAQLVQARRDAESARDTAQAEVARLASTQQEEDARAGGALAAERRRAAALQHTVDQLTAQVVRLEAEALREEREHAAAVRVALDERAVRVLLRAVDPLAGQATASATLTPDGRLLLLARGLPALPADKCYQVWVIRQDDPPIVSGGVMSVGGDGQALYATRLAGQAGRVTGFAITDEPLGGSRSARGRKLLFGAVERR
ncbi:MAG: anti-sigma factor [Vicinamibacteria bacterium]